MTEVESLAIELARHDERIKKLEERSRLQLYLLTLAVIALVSMVWEQIAGLLNAS